MRFYEFLIRHPPGASIRVRDVHASTAEKPEYIRKQLAAWAKKGWLVRVRRGVYVVPPPFAPRSHPFLLANHLVRSSYISLYAALSHYGMIPERVYTVTSVVPSPERPRRWYTPLGDFEYRRVKREFFFGFQEVPVAPGVHVRMATPEKALLDLVYLEAPADDVEGFLDSLRLARLDEQIQPDRLEAFAQKMDLPRIRKAVRWILHARQKEMEEWMPLDI